MLLEKGSNATVCFKNVKGNEPVQDYKKSRKYVGNKNVGLGCKEIGETGSDHVKNCKQDHSCTQKIMQSFDFGNIQFNWKYLAIFGKSSWWYLTQEEYPLNKPKNAMPTFKVWLFIIFFVLPYGSKPQIEANKSSHLDITMDLY